MQYSIKTSGGATDITLDGRLTFSDAPSYAKFLEELGKAPKTHWTFHLGKLEFIDSTGMSLFVHVYDLANADNIKVTIVNSTGPVREALERAAFQTLFELK